MEYDRRQQVGNFTKVSLKAADVEEASISTVESLPVSTMSCANRCHKRERPQVKVEYMTVLQTVPTGNFVPIPIDLNQAMLQAGYVLGPDGFNYVPAGNGVAASGFVGDGFGQVAGQYPANNPNYNNLAGYSNFFRSRGEYLIEDAAQEDHEVSVGKFDTHSQEGFGFSRDDVMAMSGGTSDEMEEVSFQASPRQFVPSQLINSDRYVPAHMNWQGQYPQSQVYPSAPQYPYPQQSYFSQYDKQATTSQQSVDPPTTNLPCYCDHDCVIAYDCCPDYNQLCTTVEVVTEVPYPIEVPVEVRVPYAVEVRVPYPVFQPIQVPNPGQPIITFPSQPGGPIRVPYPLEVVVEVYAKTDGAVQCTHWIYKNQEN